MEHTFNLRQISKKKKKERKKKRIERKKGRKEGRKEGRKKEREKKKERYFPKKKRRNQSGQWWHMPLIAALGKQRQTD